MESPLMLGIRSVGVNVVLHNVRRNVFERLERIGDVNFDLNKKKKNALESLVRNSGTLEIPRSKCYEVADSYETQNWKTRITKMTIADEKRELDSKLKNNSRILAETDESDDDGLAEVNPESEVIDETYQREAVLRRLAEIERRGETRILRNFERMKNQSSLSEAKGLFSKRSKPVDPSKESLESLVELLQEALQAVPDSVLHLMTGWTRSGDCGRSADQKPDWLDMEKLRRGQKFAENYMYAVFFQNALTLFVIFSIEDSLKPLIITGKSSTPYTAFKRYLSTGLRIRRWMTGDLWTKGSVANRDISTVRAMHAAVRRRLETSTTEEINAATKIGNPWCPMRETLIRDFSEACEAPKIDQCPYVVEPSSLDRPKSINQTEMALTQWCFVGLLVSFPTSFGVHYVSDEDLEAYCHLWRSIGYQLGVEDEYNFCRGTLEDIRSRTNDYLESWVKPNLRNVSPEWEHMTRCVVSGLNAVISDIAYENVLLFLTEMLDLPMPRLYASLSYTEWCRHKIRKFHFSYTLKLPGMAGWFNKFVNKATKRAENFTHDELEVIRIKMDSIYPGQNK
ncbi:uncharacterized protein LOC124185322 [Neodiprion fabricii]|uniref:uncharacterized protein LOC124185322 n=1 Tax=Neodiprion fabricii TaxID=2872261 RepID=UPI001ED8E85A|nr:uncharacterized protein LOC124185322 [Neodiprion fabricii]